MVIEVLSLFSKLLFELLLLNVRFSLLFCFLSEFGILNLIIICSCFFLSFSFSLSILSFSFFSNFSFFSLSILSILSFSFFSLSFLSFSNFSCFSFSLFSFSLFSFSIFSCLSFSFFSLSNLSFSFWLSLSFLCLSLSFSILSISFSISNLCFSLLSFSFSLSFSLSPIFSSSPNLPIFKKSFLLTEFSFLILFVLNLCLSENWLSELSFEGKSMIFDFIDLCFVSISSNLDLIIEFFVVIGRCESNDPFLSSNKDWVLLKFWFLLCIKLSIDFCLVKKKLFLFLSILYNFESWFIFVGKILDFSNLFKSISIILICFCFSSSIISFLVLLAYFSLILFVFSSTLFSLNENLGLWVLIFKFLFSSFEAKFTLLFKPDSIFISISPRSLGVGDFIPIPLCFFKLLNSKYLSFLFPLSVCPVPYVPDPILSFACALIWL